MSSSEILRRNEKTKQISSVLSNLGTALMIAAFGRIWTGTVDGWVAVWILVASMLIWSAMLCLGALESDVV